VSQWWSAQKRVAQGRFHYSSEANLVGSIGRSPKTSAYCKVDGVVTKFLILVPSDLKRERVYEAIKFKMLNAPKRVAEVGLSNEPSRPL